MYKSFPRTGDVTVKPDEFHTTFPKLYDPIKAIDGETPIESNPVMMFSKL
jgi:hypothetical protein